MGMERASQGRGIGKNDEIDLRGPSENSGFLEILYIKATSHVRGVGTISHQLNDIGQTLVALCAVS